MKGIVISTHESNKLFLDDLMDSLKNCKYPIVLVYNTPDDNHYESKGLRIGSILFKEFIFLHDTVVIHDLELFDILFDNPSKMFSIAPNFLMYLGKYDSDTLINANLGISNTKMEAVRMELKLREVFKVPCLDNSFTDGNHFEIKHNRNNMVISNRYLTKYKATYNLELVK